MIDRISIVDLARSQHGLIIREQAKAAGYSHNQIQKRLARGTWLVAERGIYRLASHPDSWLTGVLAATLSTGGIASHRTAGGLDGIRRLRPEVTVPISSARVSRRATIHRTTQWDRTGPPPDPASQ